MLIHHMDDANWSKVLNVPTIDDVKSSAEEKDELEWAAMFGLAKKSDD